MGDDGLALSDVLTFATNSKAQNKIIVLDSCHSGIVGNQPAAAPIVELVEGTTILTASTAEQYAAEEHGSVYAHVDQSLGPWSQRPMFKTNVKSFVSLRKVQPPISLDDLHRINKYFPSPGYEFDLDPSFEPESDNPNPSNTAIFSILQKFNRVNLLVPVNAPHMYHAAMKSKSCKLTVLGEHYRRLVKSKRV